MSGLQPRVALNTQALNKLSEIVCAVKAGAVDIQPMIDVLDNILLAVDGLELTTENIRIEAGQINLNTDEVEQLLEDIKLLLQEDTVGESCATPSFIKDCDRQELLDRLVEIAGLITDNATANKVELVDKLEELKTVLTSIETNTTTSNTNEGLIIAELETANTTLDAILAEQNKSLVYTTSTAICVDGVTHMTRVKTVWDNEANTAVSETAEFSLDGVTWTTTTPTGTITIGACVTEDLTGTACETPMFTEICNVDEIVNPLTTKLDEVIAAINDTSAAEQVILNSIDTKLDELVLIKDELVEANTTLVLIKDEAIEINANTDEIVTQTTLTNTKLEEIKTKLDTQISELGDIKQELIDANTSLVTANANLVTINDNIVLIKEDIADIKVDIAAIRVSISNIEADTDAIRVAVESIDLKLDTVNSHLTTIEGKLDTINDTLVAEFDETQLLLGEIKASIEFAQDTFQPVDCDGNPVGTIENVLKVVQLAPQIADICNTTDITTPIVNKLDEILEAINATEAPDYTALLTSIDTKLDELAVITTELETANTTLDGIKTDTAGIKTDTAAIVTQVTTANTNLTNILSELETQTTKLEDLKTLITDTNAELVDVNAELDVISGNITTIKDDLAVIKTDIATIKTDIATIKADTAAIKTAVQSIDTKLDTVITSLSSIEDKLDTIHNDLAGITDLLQEIKDELNQSLVYSSSQPICVDGTNHLVRVKSIWDNEAGTLVSNTTEYSTDGNVWTTTAPVGTIVLGYCSVNDNTFTTFQPTDCEGNNVGGPVDVKRTVIVNNVQTELCNTADLVNPLTSKLDEIISAINNTSTAEQTLLSSIDTKLDELALIKAELVTANTTLEGIETETGEVNENLVTVISKLDDQITELQDLQTLITTTNTKLEDVKTKLDTISTNIATLVTDISAIKVSVASIDSKLDDVITSLSNVETKLDTLHTDLTNITDVLQDIKDELDVELVYTPATKVNNATANFYSREKILFDSEANTEISRVTEFSTDGASWTTATPSGTLVIGWISTDTSADLLDKLDEVIAAINDTSDAEQLVLNSIDTKLDELALIKAELVSANATLTLIEGDTSAIQTNTGDILTQVTTSNTKLEDIKTKLDSQITLLGDLKTELIDANTSLDTANTTLTTISNDTALIKADVADIKVDIASIKASLSAIELDTEEIKTAVQSIDTKLTTVNNNLDSIETKLDTLNTTIQTEFDQTQAKLDDVNTNITDLNTDINAEFDETQLLLEEVKTAIEFAQDTFQLQDCEGNDIGTEQNVLKVVQIAKQEASICNTADISDPIVAAIEAQASTPVVGKKLDFLTCDIVAGESVTIPSGHFSTIAMLATKGEFKIENISNDFSGIITVSGGAIEYSIDISEDGITAVGDTAAPQGFDTRANSVDMDATNNSFLITCIRDGRLQLELYKS